jgi:hypothetical protein
VLVWIVTSQSQFFQAGRHFPRMRGYVTRSLVGGSRLRDRRAGGWTGYAFVWVRMRRGHS